MNTTATPKPAKLTTMERRAAALCAELTQCGGGTVDIDWAKSATWGLCPRVLWRGEKAAHASGCGYCKESTVLAEALRFLGATPEARMAIRRTGGAGVSSVEDALKAQGWRLTKVASGKMYDAFTVRRIEGV